MISKFLYSFQLMVIVTVLVNVCVPSTALADTLSQGDDPVSQCKEGKRLYEIGQEEKALPLLAAGFASRDHIIFANKEELADCAMKLGLLLYKTKPEEALDAYAVARDIYQQTNNELELAKALYNTGVTHEGQSRYTEALDLFNQALLLTKAKDDRFGMGVIINEMGYVRRVQGRYGDALDLYLQALIVEDEVTDEEGKGITLDNIGSLYLVQGRYEDALHSYEQALDVKKQGEDGEGVATTLNNIGRIYEAQGDDVTALRYYQDAQKKLEGVPHDPSNMAATLTNIGNIYLWQKNNNEARKYYEEAYPLYAAPQAMRLLKQNLSTNTPNYTTLQLT